MVVPGVHLLSDTLLMPNIFQVSGNSTAVCLINAADKDVQGCAESTVGYAVEADLRVPVPFLSRTVCTLLRRPHSRKCISNTCLRGPQRNRGAETPVG